MEQDKLKSNRIKLCVAAYSSSRYSDLDTNESKRFDIIQSLPYLQGVATQRGRK